MSTVVTRKPTSLFDDPETQALFRKLKEFQQSDECKRMQAETHAALVALTSGVGVVSDLDFNDNIVDAEYEEVTPALIENK